MPFDEDDGRDAKQPTGFEVLVEHALDSLPQQFQRLLGDVAIVIEDVPSPTQMGLNGAPEHGWLYGLYEGIPGIEWGADMAPFPNKITLFQ
ncbi:MAG: metallopeptidase family protein, partial [Chloroflexota bacterium]